MRSDLPSGTVTFLFTDVEGSTRLLHSLGAEGYADALAEHRRVIREACAAEGGVDGYPGRRLLLRLPECAESAGSRVGAPRE
jgi:class 3 adenylate cyclase